MTDDEVRWAIRAAKERGLKVCLKPVVNVRNGTWRAHINFFDIDVPPEPTWSQWFAGYTEFIVHHARIAAEEGAEMFCIGCEMVQSDRREAQWRALIAEVRAVYPGLVTYNCDKYQEDHVGWWDAVDVISSSGYYPVTTGRTSWTASSRWSPRTASRSSSWRPAAPAGSAPPRCPTTGPCRGPVRAGAGRLVPRRPSRRARAATGCAASCSGTGRRGCTTRPTRRTDDDYCMFGKAAETVVRAEYTRAR